MPLALPRMSLTAVFEPVEDGWTQAHIQELPDVVTAGPSVSDAKALLIDALREYLLSLGDDSAAVATSNDAVKESFELQFVGLT